MYPIGVFGGRNWACVAQPPPFPFSGIWPATERGTLGQWLCEGGRRWSSLLGTGQVSLVWIQGSVHQGRLPFHHLNHILKCHPHKVSGWCFEPPLYLLVLSLSQFRTRERERGNIYWFFFKLHSAVRKQSSSHPGHWNPSGNAPCIMQIYLEVCVWTSFLCSTVMNAQFSMSFFHFM